MITRIEIDGFKSFRDFALDLEPLTCIVGPNSAGKSNLLDAIQLLSHLFSYPVRVALARGRGRILDQFSRTAEGQASRMTLAVELHLAQRYPGQFRPALLPREWERVRYQVQISRTASESGRERVQIESESLMTLPGREEHLQPAPAPHDGSWLMPIGTHSYIMLYTRLELTEARFLHCDAVKLRQPSQRAAEGALGWDGDNLPTMLAAQPPAVLAQIRADLAALVPGIRTFEVITVDDEFQIEVEFSDGQRMPARILSDGTLRVLAFLALLHSAEPSGSALIGLEEPENGIFPGRLRAFLEMLQRHTAPREGSEVPTQVLLNSHSPTVLAALHGQPRSVVFADQIRHPDGLRWTRMRHLAGPGERGGMTAVSQREIQAMLDSVRADREGDA